MDQRRTVRGYALAVLALALATLIRWLLDPYLSHYTPFPTYFAAVAFVGLYGGLGPSIFTVVAGGLVANVLFLPAPATEVFSEVESWVSLLLFSLASALIVALTEWLRVSSANLAAIVSTAHEGIVTWSIEGLVTGWNAGAERMYGYGRDEMLGVPLARLAPPHRAAETRWIVAEIQAGRPVETLETQRLRKDGQAIDVLVSAAPIRDARGRVTGVASIERDVTERKRVERARRTSEARLRAIIDNAPVLLFIKDLEGRYFLVNRSYLEQAGGSIDRVLGTTDFDRFPPDTARRYREHDLAVIRSGEPGKFEETATVGDEVRTFISTKFPLRDDRGEIYAVCGIATDITDETRRHEQLLDLDRRKDQFLSMLAHELRNPLAPIANAVQLIRLEDAAANGRIGWAGEVIERQVKHLTRMVDDLLDIARFNTGRVQLRWDSVDLVPLARQGAEDLRSRFQAAGVDLEVSLIGDEIRVNADAARLLQVIDNLLDNAAKYTDPGGRARLTLKTEGDQAVLSVADSGIGIDQGDLAHVFEVFEQVDDSLDRSSGGLGLGLNLVRRMVELHRGSVTAHSAGRGQGSEFVVRLPLLASEAPDTPADRGGSASSSAAAELSHSGDATCLSSGPETGSRRVLVIEDNPDTARSMELLLKALGHDVRVARSGGEGVEMAAQHQPGLVLVDLGLPDIDGYRVARLLRDRYGAGLRLVALTGYGQEEHRRRSREAGFDDHLLKPLSLDSLDRLLAASPA